MVDTTDIEKKSLEAHVELCAERYKFLEEKMESFEEKLTALVTTIVTVKASIDAMNTKSNDRLISWGVGIIVSLVGAVGYLITHYVIK